MKLILTRHGETIENKMGLAQGQLIQGKLTELGIEQAKKLALRLKNEKIDAIYSSDLERAANTAKEIMKYHKDTPFYLAKELREVDLGRFAGKNTSSINWEKRPMGIETRAHMGERIKRLLDNVYKKYPDDNVLFVGHGGINKVLINLIVDKGVDYMNQIRPYYNTSVSIFEIKEDQNHKVHLLNCIKHLE